MTKPRIPTAEQRAEAERLQAEYGEQAQEEREADEQRRRERREAEAATRSESTQP
jgi:hypothetical protein